MKVKVLSNTPIRRSNTETTSAPLGQIFKDTIFDVENKKYEGASFSENSTTSNLWYKDSHGWYYWSGALQIQAPIPANIPTVNLPVTPPPPPAVTPITDDANVDWNYKTSIKNVPATWLATEGKNINIVVIDNGFDLSHPALKHLDIAGRKYDATAINYLNSTGNDDITGVQMAHGNEVATMLAAMPLTTFSIKGVAVQANYYFIKARQHFKHPKYFVNALELATTKLNADIISYSIPFMTNISPDDETRRQHLYQTIETEKIALIGSIGNSVNRLDTLNDVPYPAKLTGSFTVGALTKTIFDNFPNAKYSERIDLLMPSMEKLLCNQNASVKLPGSSSFATPYFAGTYACYLSQLGGRSVLKNNPAYQNKTMEEILLSEFVKPNQDMFRPYSEYTLEDMFLIPTH